MKPQNEVRFNFLRLALAPVCLAVVAFALAHRRTSDWRPLQMLVFALPFAALAVVVAYKVAFGSADRRYLSFVREDGPVEYATVVAFLIGSVVAAAAAVRARDWQARGFLALFGLAMLFVALSEVSFGQRLIGLETPETLLRVNRQKEITVHNIHGIEFVVYRVMPHVILAYALLSRQATRRLEGGLLSRDLLAVAPMPWYSVGYFVPMALFSAKQQIVGPTAVFKDQEPSELFLGIGFLLVAINAWAILAHRGQPAPAAARAVAFGPPAPSRR
jgi:hypothetical protein